MIAGRPMLGPLVVLAAWTMIVLAWMTLARSTAFKRAQIEIGSLARGTHGADLDRLLDQHAQWKAHNYNHLLEQPTLFYALCLTLAVIGAEERTPTTLAWAYVVLRIAHSLIQVSVNIVLYRALLFALSSLCLIGLAAFAFWMVMF